MSGVDEQGTIGVSKGDTRKWSEAAEATRRKKSLLGVEPESPKPQELGVRALESQLRRSCLELKRDQKQEGRSWGQALGGA